MDEFFRTRMGVRFFGTTMPKIADELERLNRNLEALVKALEPAGDTPENTPGERRPDVAP